jgi:nitronate monooxygenase
VAPTLDTAFTRLVGCSLPIQVAPMGAISTPAMVAAAVDAGAHALIGTAGMAPAAVLAVLDDVESRTRRPIGANMLMPFADPAIVEAVAPRVGVFDFYHGDPDEDLVAAVHDAGALAAWQVGSLDEALAAIDAGCDILAVRGLEGGGRMHGREPLLPLLGQVLDRAGGVPVLAAGGLATGRDLAAVLAAGAAGARMGTRFVATDESGAHPVYKQAIVDADSDETDLVTDFSVLWPPGPQPHRVLRRALEAARAVEGDIVGEMTVLGETQPIPRFAVIPPSSACSGNIEAWAMYAGVSAGSVDRIEPTADVVARIAAEAAELLARAPGR